eukprot:CAMPEP_0197851528 /NCGR_PEP_ID=MMETSP1438-20131217/18273_1 /TAXON_ID=1461541 /ORGANISM="Pterosperma sp., Strain CCMP1384" /LENGTH=202 /DNA_ID=CAMNT_0043465151 /DNA_START=46 /DNA_END=651 /DNA_ORIENTATION=+
MKASLHLLTSVLLVTLLARPVIGLNPRTNAINILTAELRQNDSNHVSDSNDPFSLQTPSGLCEKKVCENINVMSETCSCWSTCNTVSGDRHCENPPDGGKFDRDQSQTNSDGCSHWIPGNKRSLCTTVAISDLCQDGACANTAPNSPCSCWSTCENPVSGTECDNAPKGAKFEKEDGGSNTDGCPDGPYSGQEFRLKCNLVW